MTLMTQQNLIRLGILNDNSLRSLFRSAFASLLVLAQGTFAIWYPRCKNFSHKAIKSLNRVQDFVGWVRQLVAGKGSLKTEVVRPPDPVGEGTKAPAWATASLEREWAERFLRGEVTLPTRPVPPPPPAGPAPRNRAERHTAARGQPR